MCHYKHLTLIERKDNVCRAQNYSVTAIAHELHRSKATISRELKRNSSSGIYQPAIAQRKYVNRRKACRPHKRLDDAALQEYVRDMFQNQQWSPEKIAGRLALEHRGTVVSYSTIQREIYAGRFDDPHRSHGNRGVVRKLRHRGKTRYIKNQVERGGKIRISKDIAQRPAGKRYRYYMVFKDIDTLIDGFVNMSHFIEIIQNL